MSTIVQSNKALQAGILIFCVKTQIIFCLLGAGACPDLLVLTRIYVGSVHSIVEEQGTYIDVYYVYSSSEAASVLAFYINC